LVSRWGRRLADVSLATSASDAGGREGAALGAGGGCTAVVRPLDSNTTFMPSPSSSISLPLKRPASLGSIPGLPHTLDDVRAPRIPSPRDPLSPSLHCGPASDQRRSLRVDEAPRLKLTCLGLDAVGADGGHHRAFGAVLEAGPLQDQPLRRSRQQKPQPLRCVDHLSPERERRGRRPWLVRGCGRNGDGVTWTVGARHTAQPGAWNLLHVG